MQTITNEDCMAMMSRYPDKYFDLAIVDPPYGINMDGGKYGIDGAMKHLCLIMIERQKKLFRFRLGAERIYMNT